jgi:hypothetical protein
VGQLLATWRDVARDVAIAAHGGRSELRQPELVDELTAASARLDPAAVTDFVARLDSSISALDAYANPELMLDSLLLAWPAA